MSKGLTYYTSGDSISQIATEYGEKLQDLTWIERLHLMSVISGFLSAIADDTEFYDLASANNDHWLVSTPEVDRILELLQTDINESTLKGFLLALANQIYDNPIVFDQDGFDDAYTTLLEDGMSESIARKAAQVAAVDHPALPRTAAAQAAVDAAIAQFKGLHLPPDRLAALLEPVH